MYKERTKSEQIREEIAELKKELDVALAVERLQEHSSLEEALDIFITALEAKLNESTSKPWITYAEAKYDSVNVDRYIKTPVFKSICIDLLHNKGTNGLRSHLDCLVTTGRWLAKAVAEHSLCIYGHIEDEEDRKAHNLRVKDAYLADKSLPVELYGIKTDRWYPINTPVFEDTAMQNNTYRVRKQKS